MAAVVQEPAVITSCVIPAPKQVGTFLLQRATTPILFPFSPCTSNVYMIHKHITCMQMHIHMCMYVHYEFSSMEQKATMVHLVRDSIQEQQKLFGTLSGTSTRSPSLCGQSSAAASSNSLLPQQIKTKTNNKFSYHFTPSSTQTL